MSKARHDRRRRRIAAIHAIAKARGIPEDDRREMQRRAVGVDSCADMTVAQLDRVLSLMGREGREGAERWWCAGCRKWLPSRPGDDATCPDCGRALIRPAARPRQGPAAMRRKALAIAADFGAGPNYVDAIARRQSGKPLRDCDAEQIRAVIAACYTARKRRKAAVQ